MKVRDVLKALKSMNPDDDIVLKHLYTSPEVVMTKIRVYPIEGRVIIDGYEKEKHGAHKENQT